MPRTALALCLIWFVSLFLFRSLVQLRRTGSTGIKGFHGPVGSRAWVAGVSVMLGFVLAPAGPVAALYKWPGGGLFPSNLPLQVFGAGLTVIGIAGALIAQMGMGPSWRIGVDDTETTALVTTGLFAWVRNPIFSFIWLSMVGLVLLVPNYFSFLAASLTVLGIELQVRAVEEPYLVSTHDREYGLYASRVGRFLPGIGLLCSKSEIGHNAGGA